MVWALWVTTFARNLLMWKTKIVFLNINLCIAEPGETNIPMSVTFLEGLLRKNSTSSGNWTRAFHKHSGNVYVYTNWNISTTVCNSINCCFVYQHRTPENVLLCIFQSQSILILLLKAFFRRMSHYNREK